MKGACDPVGMVRNEKKGKDFPKKNSGTFLGGGRIKGDVCGGNAGK